MKRAFIMVLDSFGIGASEDASHFGDVGSDTLGHIAEACAKYQKSYDRNSLLNLPNLTRLGLAKAYEGSTGKKIIGLSGKTEVISAYAWAHEISFGKDTLSGHWEIAGIPILFNWDYFSNYRNSFPKTLLKKIVERTNLPGYLGNCHSSGTVILDKFGEEHIETSKPIFYTSKDSVFQIACHEKIFGLERLYELCKIVHEELIKNGYNIGRVIARPFIGMKRGSFQRTENRYDLVSDLQKKTVFQKLIDEVSGHIVAVGKVADIYANRGITKIVKTTGLNALFNATIKEIKKASNKTIVLTNFVDFDSSWGHRRDVIGYAAGLELFDRRLPEILKLINKDDILILTADHGCDPTWIGTDHTREHVPVLIYSPKIKPTSFGHRRTFADIGQTIAKYFDISDMEYGEAMI